MAPHCALQSRLTLCIRRHLEFLRQSIRISYSASFSRSDTISDLSLGGSPGCRGSPPRSLGHLAHHARGRVNTVVPAAAHTPQEGREGQEGRSRRPETPRDAPRRPETPRDAPRRPETLETLETLETPARGVAGCRLKHIKAADVYAGEGVAARPEVLSTRVSTQVFRPPVHTTVHVCTL